MIYIEVTFGIDKNQKLERAIKIIIPEDLNYTEIFDDLLKKYTKEYELINVKATNMGSMFKLIYDIILKNKNDEKIFIDDLR